MSKVLLLASGGLDSTTVAHKLNEADYHVFPLFFDYGQHCVETEWNRVNEVLKGVAEKPERICISDLFQGSRSRLIVAPNLWEEKVEADDFYIPYRTVVFFAAAAARAQTLGIFEVYAGFINSNHAKELDCTAEFMNKLDGFAETVGPIKFISPLRFWSKQSVALEAVRLGVPIGRTFSCQAAEQLPCGACPNCVERLDALRAAGLLK